MISSSKIAIFQWGFTSQLISLLTPLCGAWTGGRNQLELPKKLICLILQDVIRVNNWGISNCFCLGISYQELFGIISRIMWYKIMPWRFPNNFRWFPSNQPDFILATTASNHNQGTNWMSPCRTGPAEVLSDIYSERQYHLELYVIRIYYI
jgi:hypothetical protein